MTSQYDDLTAKVDGGDVGGLTDEMDNSVFMPAVDPREELPRLSKNFIVSCLEKQHLGDAEMLKRLYSDRIVYDGAEKRWYVWDGHRWRRDDAGVVLRLCATQVAGQYTRLARQTIKSSGGFSREREKADEKFADRLLERAANLRRTPYVRAMLGFAEGELALRAEWDSQPWLLAVRNGVIDLRTGECRPGLPEDYLRVYSPVEWQGLDAPAPRWERFLKEIFEDDELIDYLGRFFGYSITGLTTEHVLMVFYGREGRNGKDTLLNTFRYVLGRSIVDAVSNDVLLADRRGTAGAATPHLIALRGKRLVWCNESDARDRLSISQVKHLTGGGAIPVRGLYQEATTFEPTFKVILMTNYRPQIDAGPGDPIWNRLKLVELINRFVDNPSAPNERRVDKQLGEALRAEASGILAWLVRYCLEWQRRGLADEPASVRAAVQAYRKNEDVLGTFLEECCVVVPNARVQAAKVYEAYRAWCAETGTPAWSGKVFGERMSALFTKKRTSSAAVYEGVGLRASQYE